MEDSIWFPPPRQTPAILGPLALPQVKTTLFYSHLWYTRQGTGIIQLKEIRLHVKEHVSIHSKPCFDNCFVFYSRIKGQSSFSIKSAAWKLPGIARGRTQGKWCLLDWPNWGTGESVFIIILKRLSKHVSIQDVSNALEVECIDGWTKILHRENGNEEVQKDFCFLLWLENE